MRDGSQRNTRCVRAVEQDMGAAYRNHSGPLLRERIFPSKTQSQGATRPTSDGADERVSPHA
jgi:hypothetical protein